MFNSTLPDAIPKPQHLHMRPGGAKLADDMKRILVAGAVGQIGSELTMELRKQYGNDNVVAMGRKTKPSDELLNSGPFVYGNVTDYEELKKIITDATFLSTFCCSATECPAYRTRRK